MAVIFLSYSRQDAEFALTLRDALEQRTGHHVFLDDAPRRPGVTAGDRWRDSLLFGLRRAAAVVFLATPSACRSAWCVSELAIARFRKIPIVAVTTSPRSRLPSVIDDLQFVHGSRDVSNLVERLEQALAATGIRRRLAAAWTGDRPPYPGLNAFGPADSAVFFGRDTDLESMLLAFDAVNDSGRVIVLDGPSGSGKSSFLSAALLPSLQANGWSIVGPMNAGRDDVPGSLRRLPAPGGARSLIAVDQAEPLVDGGPDPDIDVALAESVETVKAAGWWQLYVLRTEFTVPSDHTGRLLGLVDLHLTLGLLTRSRLREAIVQPGRLAGIDFEEDVVEAMIDATVGTEALPLLAFTLNHIWTQLEVDQLRSATVTMAQYGDGVEGTLVRHADAAYAELPPELRSDVVPTFARLVSVRSRQPPTSTPVGIRQFSSHERRVLAPFRARRLVVDVETSAPRNEPRIQPTHGSDDDPEGVALAVAHEALLSRWPVLRDGVEALRDELELADEVTRASAAWERSGRRDATYLLAGDRLSRSWRSRAVADRSDLADFVHASRRNARHRRTGQVAGWAAGLVVVVVPLVLLVIYVVDRRAEDQAKSRARGPTFLVDNRVNPFEIEVHEVSAEQYDTCVDAGACDAVAPPPGLEVGGTDRLAPQRAMVWVDAQQAGGFCDWLGRRLPTAEQWRSFAEVAVNIWATDPPAGASDQGRPRPVRSDTPNFGNVVEFTRSPAPGTDVVDEDGLPAIVLALGISGELVAADPRLVEEWVDSPPYEINADTRGGGDVGFRCVN